MNFGIFVLKQLSCNGAKILDTFVLRTVQEICEAVNSIMVNNGYVVERLHLFRRARKRSRRHVKIFPEETLSKTRDWL
jgi:hypothetical protein